MVLVDFGMANVNRCHVGSLYGLEISSCFDPC